MAVPCPALPTFPPPRPRAMRAHPAHPPSHAPSPTRAAWPRPHPQMSWRPHSHPRCSRRRRWAAPAPCRQLPPAASPCHLLRASTADQGARSACRQRLPGRFGRPSTVRPQPIPSPSRGSCLAGAQPSSWHAPHNSQRPASTLLPPPDRRPTGLDGGALPAGLGHRPLSCCRVRLLPLRLRSLLRILPLLHVVVAPHVLALLLANHLAGQRDAGWTRMS